MSDKPLDIASSYLQNALKLYAYYKKLGDKTFEQIEDNDISWRPNEESNSIAILVKHISGNMLSRWTDFLKSDGEKPLRNRDDEFEDDISSKDELVKRWEQGWNCLFSMLQSLEQEDLLRSVRIRKETHTVLEAINRQLTHYAYHIGQIIYVAKSIKSLKWQSLSIPKGESDRFNKEMFSKGSNNK